VSSITPSVDWAERPAVLDAWPPRMRSRHELALEDPAAAAALAAQAWDEVLRFEWQPEVMRGSEIAEGDRWVFEDASRTAMFDAQTREWSRQGSEGVKWDLTDVVLPWGFRLAEITIPVTIWRGHQDLEVTADDVDFSAAILQSCSVVTWPDSGHLGFVKHWADILDALV
jgi:pimeloyl-ACP methyl ester carboxylesterase